MANLTKQGRCENSVKDFCISFWCLFILGDDKILFLFTFKTTLIFIVYSNTRDFVNKLFGTSIVSFAYLATIDAAIISLRSYHGCALYIFL